MIAKKWIPGIVIVLVLVGFLTATAGRHWWKSQAQAPAPAPEAALPGAATEYGKIMERYHGKDSSMRLSGTIRIYDEENDNALKETKTFRYIRSATQYYMQLSYLQTFSNGTIQLQLDTVHKRILVTKAADAGTSGDNAGKTPIDILFSDTSRFKLSGTVSSGQGTERALHLQSDFSPQIRACHLFYDTVTYTLHRAEIEWWKNGPDPDGFSSNKIWLVKMEYQYHPAQPWNADDKIRQIISIVNGQIRPTDAYREYQVNANFN